jgi:4-aminobutyrate aminotransferase-like enzyme/Ser/Thr protein kinase RdoA (MazF antagonist)
VFDKGFGHAAAPAGGTDQVTTSPALVEEIVRNHWGLVAVAKRLGGELDENFELSTSENRTIFKLMREGCDPDFVVMQIAALSACHDFAVTVPKVITASTGEQMLSLPVDGVMRIGWLISHLPGDLLARHLPISAALAADIGTGLAQLDRQLSAFDHPLLTRPLKWDPAGAEWIADSLDVHIDLRRRAIIADILDALGPLQAILSTAPRAVIHGDANDMNLFVDAGDARLCGIIDFGDMIRTARICEAAIAAAYAMMGADDPVAIGAALLAGYHNVLPLTDDEIRLFFPLARARLAISVTCSAQSRIPGVDDGYLQISERPAWTLLGRLDGLDGQLVEMRMRAACGLEALPGAAQIEAWLHANHEQFAPIIAGLDLMAVPLLDLSFTSPLSADNPEAPSQSRLNQNIADSLLRTGQPFAIGGYGEPRPIYGGGEFGDGITRNRRQRHLGIDVTASVGQAISAPIDGTILMRGTAGAPFDYGGWLVLEHSAAGHFFWSLYGHLDPASLTAHQPGDRISAGQAIGLIGCEIVNGGWWPHVHFQLLLQRPTGPGTPDGACDPDWFDMASILCPNPAIIFGVAPEKLAWTPPGQTALLKRRQRLTVSNLSVSYHSPFMPSRGWRHYLYDHEGRRYFDAYNNVPHVGHAHPAIISAVTEQMRLVTTNSRYLHENMLAFAEAITARLPDPLSVCLFVNSASEANELALRLSRAATGKRGIVVMNHGYHGMTTGAIDISPYKFNHPRGIGKSDWVHVAPQPDLYRGGFEYGDAATIQDFIDASKAVVADATASADGFAAYISECAPSVGGQIMLPSGFLKEVYTHVRAQGGVCIADDVQTALGRLGAHFWGFEYQDVVPDILVLGKPLGNGQPLGAVVTTREIADKFAEGPEFFSTFGGSTVSCAAGIAVLKVIEEEGLQSNALRIGEQLLASLHDIASRHACVGDIRGSGLFLGLELVSDRDSRTPAPALATYVTNRLYDRRFLIGTEGPHHNVLKIRPPMTFDSAAATAIVETLDAILSEPKAMI